MTKKRKIALAVCIIILVLLCGYPLFTRFKEKHDKEVMYKQAYSNARQNIRDKYGFDAELYESEWDKSANPRCAKMGCMWFTAKHDGKEFQVLSSCLAADHVSLDDYQYDEIKSALLDEISKEFPEGKFVDCELSEYIPWGGVHFGTSAFHTFYDGNNLDKVLGNGFGNISVAFAGADFSDMHIDEWLSGLNIDFEFTSFDTEEHLEEFCQEPSGRYIDDYYRFKLFAPYITDHYEIKDGEVKRLDIKLQSCGDFMYACFSDKWDFPVSEETEVKERYLVSQMFEYYGEGEYVSKPITGEYYFGSWNVYIYYPLEALKDYDLENIGAAWYSDSTDTNNRNIEKRITVCGDYAVFSLPFGHTSFMLVDTSGYEEYVPGWVEKYQRR